VAVAKPYARDFDLKNPTVLSQNGSGFDTSAEKGLILNCPERLQRPFIGRSVATENIQVVIIGTHFEERGLRAIPLVQPTTLVDSLSTSVENLLRLVIPQ
jgi:hypothetical protein